MTIFSSIFLQASGFSKGGNSLYATGPDAAIIISLLVANERYQLRYPESEIQSDGWLLEF